LSFLIIIVVLLLLMWVMLVRPQRRKQADQQSMLDHLSEGDEIITAGGLYATVRSVEGDDVHVEIAPGTEVRLAKRAIAAIVPPEQEEGEAEELDEPESDEEDALAAAGDSGSESESRR
jgi:preprotein translocase subunit YajC